MQSRKVQEEPGRAPPERQDCMASLPSWTAELEGRVT